MQGVLYFPYIEVPSSTWFTRTLLYWDHVGTIMPMGEMMRPERWSGYTNALVRAELLRLVDPREGHIGMLDATFGAYLASLSDEEMASRRQSCELDEIEPIFKAKMPEEAVFFNLLDL